MSAGFFARYRSHLFSHPSFWASEDRPLEIIESTSLVNAEKRVYVLLQSLSLPLVLNIEDCAVNVAALLGEDRTDQTQHLYRLQSMKGHLVTGFGWRTALESFSQDAHNAYKADRLVRDVDPVIAQQIISSRLRLAHLEAIPVKPASNSDTLFQAVSLALWGTPMHAQTLIHTVVKQMQNAPAQYRCFLGRDFDRYLQALLDGYTVGDELTLRALADHYGVPIVLVTADRFSFVLRYAPDKRLTARELFFAVISPGTYMPIRRAGPMANLKLSIASTSSAGKK